MTQTLGDGLFGQFIDETSDELLRLGFTGSTKGGFDSANTIFRVSDGRGSGSSLCMNEDTIRIHGPNEPAILGRFEMSSSFFSSASRFEITGTLDVTDTGSFGALTVAGLPVVITPPFWTSSGDFIRRVSDVQITGSTSISGSILVRADSAAQIQIRSQTNDFELVSIERLSSTEPDGGAIKIRNNNTASIFMPSSRSVWFNTDGLKFGIGTNAPKETLEVTGSTKFTGIVDITRHNFTGSVNISNSLDIDGNITLTGLIDGVNLSIFSASVDNSISANATTISLNVSSASLAAATLSLHETEINLLQAGSSSFWTGSTNGAITRNSDVEITGNLRVDGIIIANEFHTEFVSSSIIFSSGSTKFGDDLTDRHNFTGSLIVSNSFQLEGTASITGSVIISGDILSNNITLLENTSSQLDQTRVGGRGSGSQFEIGIFNNANELSSTASLFYSASLLSISGSISSSGNINGVDISEFSSSAGIEINNLQATASNHRSRIIDLESSASLIASTGSILTISASLNAATASDHRSRIIDLESTSSLNTQTASLNAFSASQNASTGSQNASSASLNTSTASDHNLRIVALEATTSENSGSIVLLQAGSSSFWTGSSDGTIARNSDIDITGSLTVTDTIFANEIHTTLVSSSILFKSGSTKFGDTADDRHDFTGSVNISGSLNLPAGTILNLTKNFGYHSSSDGSGSFSGISGSFIDGLINETMSVTIPTDGNYRIVGQGNYFNLGTQNVGQSIALRISGSGNIFIPHSRVAMKDLSFVTHTGAGGTPVHTVNMEQPFQIETVASFSAGDEVEFFTLATSDQLDGWQSMSLFFEELDRFVTVSSSVDLDPLSSSLESRVSLNESTASNHESRVVALETGSGSLWTGSVDGHISRDSDVEISGALRISHSVEVDGTITISHSADIDGEHLFQIDADTSTFADIEAIDIIYTTDIVSGQENIILQTINRTGSTDGTIFGNSVMATSGAADVFALKANVGVNPIFQDRGTFVNPESGLINAADNLAAFTSSTNNVPIFVADNDTVTLGNSIKFTDIEVILDTPASNPGIKPTFEFSNGVGFTTFVPTDGTNGMKNSGIISWVLDDIPAWTITSSEFLIRITRTQNNLNTIATESLIQIASSTIHQWDKDGNLDVNQITASNIVASASFFRDNIEISGTLKISSSDALVLQVVGDTEITGNVDIDGIVTVRELHTVQQTSSILFQSGSTKFGNSMDDIHEFTGSTSFTGSFPTFETENIRAEYLLYLEESASAGFTASATESNLLNVETLFDNTLTAIYQNEYTYSMNVIEGLGFTTESYVRLSDGKANRWVYEYSGSSVWISKRRIE